MSIPFIDLKAQRARLKDGIDAAVMRVLDHGGYVMGPEVGQFEKELGAFGQAAHVLSCANGTDALALPLMAWGIGRGDAVFCPSFTFAATAEVVPWTDATPVFVDVLPDTYNMDPAHLERAIEEVKAKGEVKGAKIWNHINIRATGVQAVSLWLNPTLIDFSKPSLIRINGQQLGVAKMIPHDVGVLLETLHKTGDRSRLFTARVDIKVGGGN